LRHEARDDAMERVALEVHARLGRGGHAPLAGTEASKVLRRLRDLVSKELKYHPPGGSAADGDIEEHAGIARHFAKSAGQGFETRSCGQGNGDVVSFTVGTQACTYVTKCVQGMRSRDWDGQRSRKPPF